MKKAILITNIPNPYRIPLFNEISSQLLSKNIHLKLIFGAGGYSRRMFKLNLEDMKFDHTILDDTAHTFSKDGEKTIFLYRGLSKLLRKENPDVIIVAGFSSATIKVLFHKFFSKTPYIIYSGTIQTRAESQSVIRRWQRSVLMKYSNAFVAYGNLAKEYLLECGVKADRIFIARNTVDTGFFERETNLVRKASNAVNEITHFTYLGYLVPRKNVQLLLEAIQLVSQKRKNFCLDIIGDGMEREKLENFVDDHQLHSYVKFHGFRQKSELPAFFAKSSGFLFQTDFDIWGLVLNEAMAAGIPCIASPNAGATFDLVKEGETGFVVDFRNREMVAEKIIWLIDNKEAAAAMGTRGASFIRNHVTLEKAAEGFLNSIEYTLNTN